MEARYELRCLGTPALLIDGAVVRVRARKHLALLIYLAVEDRWHRREHLADLLWPRASTGEARHSLATALSFLRGRLDRHTVLADRERVRLAPGRLTLDLDRLAAGDILGSELTPLLDVGAFLHEFEVPGVPEFSLWRDRHAARLLPIVRDALVRLMDQCRRTGAFREIEQHADLLLSLDSLSEDAIKAKMEARAFAGDRLGAVRLFEGWKDQIASEFGAVPSALVSDMASRLRRGDAEEGKAKVYLDVARTEQWRNRIFVGRAKEYAQLYEAWESSKAANPRQVLIVGESGVGKSTLVERLLTAATLEGAIVSRIQCHDVEREVPYASLSSLLNGLLQRPGASAAPPHALAELSRILPSIRTRFPSLPETSTIEGEAARVRLTEAVFELIAAVADECPTVLVIDDLHHADEGSIAILHVVLRRLTREPVLTVLAARSEELARNCQAQRLSESWRMRGAGRVTLPPLSDGESEPLLDALLLSVQSLPTTAERRALVRAAAGIPMVLELLVSDWEAHGRDSLALSLGAMTEVPVNGVGASSQYKTLANRVMSTLDAPSRTVLGIAALLGNELSDPDLYSFADLSLGQVLAALTQLTELHILRNASNSLEFVNELVRAHVYLSVPARLRREIHGQIADRLVARWTSGKEATPLSIAWHCLRAGRLAEATRFLLRGSRDAIRVGAVHEAERGLASVLPYLSTPDRKEVLLLLVDTLQEQGKWEESIAAIEQFGDLADPMTRCAWLSACSYARCRSFAEASEIFVELLPIMEHAASAHVRVRALRVGASIVSALREPEIGRRLAVHAESIPVDDLTDFERQQLALSRAQILYFSGDPGTALQLLEDFTSTTELDETRTSLVARIQVGIGVLRCVVGDYEGALAATQPAYAIATLLGNDELTALVASQLALSTCRLGRYGETIEWVSHARRIATTTNTPYVHVQFAYYGALAKAMKGSTDEAVTDMEMIEGSLPRSAPLWTWQACRLFKADILCLAGHRDRATAAAAEAIDLDKPELRVSTLAGPFCRWLAALGRRGGLSGSARLFLDRLAADIKTLDALDQVEVLWSIADVGEIGTTRTSAPEQVAEEKLRRFPPATVRQLRLLRQRSLEISS